MQGLGFSKEEFDNDKTHIIRIAREYDRLGDVGEALIEMLTSEELEEALANLIVEPDKEYGDWIISYMDK